MGRVRAAGFRQCDLREAAGQPRRPAQGDRDFVFQGSGCRLGETGNPDRPQGHWHGSVWPVGYSNQHYGKAISTFRELNKAPGASRGLCCAADSPFKIATLRWNGAGGAALRLDNRIALTRHQRRNATTHNPRLKLLRFSERRLSWRITAIP